MKSEIYEVEQGHYHLTDYDQVYADFDWSEVEKAFSWHTTGRVNMAYECIDRHVDLGKGDKVALYYKDKDRNEKYTFSDMKVNSNKAANVPKNAADVKKGDRVFIFMPRSPGAVFCVAGCLKNRCHRRTVIRGIYGKGCEGSSGK